MRKSIGCGFHPVASSKSQAKATLPP